MELSEEKKEEAESGSWCSINKPTSLLWMWRFFSGASRQYDTVLSVKVSEKKIYTHLCIIDRRTNGQMDGRTDGLNNGPTDGQNLL